MSAIHPSRLLRRIKLPQLHRLRSLTILVSAIGAALISPAQDPLPVWSTLGSNSEHSGYVPITLGPVRAKHLWTKDFSSQPHRVVVGDGAVFVVPDGTWGTIGQVWALGMYSGDTLWSTTLTPEPHSMNPPTYHDGRVYIQRGNNKSDSQLWSLDANNGDLVWKARYQPQWSRYLPPIVAEDNMWVPDDGWTRQYRLSDGLELQSINVGQYEGWTPAYRDGKLYTWLNGVLSQFDAETGERLKATSKHGSEWSPSGGSTPVITADRAFASNRGGLFAFDLETLELVWSYPDSTPGVPSVSNGQVFVKNENRIFALNSETGELEANYTATDTLLSSPLIVTDDKIIAPSNSRTFIFERDTKSLEYAFDASGPIALAGRTLYISENGQVQAWLLTSADGSINFPPIGHIDQFDAIQDQPLKITATETVGLRANDTDLEGDPFDTTLHTEPQNGTVEVQPNGSFTYTPAEGFWGTDEFYYVARDANGSSLPTRVELHVLSSQSPYIEIEVFQNGEPIAEGEPVTGEIQGTITVYNSTGQHAQLYKNFRILHPNEHGHSIDTNAWTRTFKLDTSEFYDGENLISVHAHPHNHPGHPYSVDFTVGSFKLLTANDNPAPNGDTDLPTLEINSELISLSGSSSATLPGHRLTADEWNAFKLVDDGDPIDIDQEKNKSNGGQIIPHIGASVLGRFRWPIKLTFAENVAFSDVYLLPFQTTEPREARIVFFIQDEVGRANYAFHTFTIPAIGQQQMESRPINAQILNISQGDTIILPEEEDFEVEVLVSFPHWPGRSAVDHLYLWVGNRAVSFITLDSYWDELNDSDTSFVVKIKLPRRDIELLQEAREVSPDSTAFAVWLDFSFGSTQDFSLPTSEHVHVTSIRTSDHPSPFGPPRLVRSQPTQPLSFTADKVAIDLFAVGNLPDGYQIRYQIDEQATQILAAHTSRIVANDLERGTHTLFAQILDEQGNRLENSEASLTLPFDVLNRVSKPVFDGYHATQNEPLTVSSDKGLLVNDSDPDEDTMQVILDTPPVHGFLSLEANGSFQYLPQDEFTGLDAFRYKVFDGFEYSESVTVQIEVIDQSLNPQRPTDWKSFANGPSHGSFYDGAIRSLPPRMLWRIGLEGDTAVKTPIAANGKVFVTSQTEEGNHILYALNGETGEQIWTHLLHDDDLKVSPLYYSEGTLFVANDQHHPQYGLRAINASDGTLVWGVETPTRVDHTFPPLVFESKIFMTTNPQDGLHAFDASDGSILYSNKNEQQRRYWGPSFYNGKLYTSALGILKELNPETGATVRSKTVFNYVKRETNANLISFDNRIAFLMNKDVLIAIDLETFEKLWTRRELYSKTPICSNGQVFASDQHGYYAFDALTGDLQMTYDSHSYLYGSNAIVTLDKLIVITPHETIIHDRISGRKIHTIPAGGHACLADGILYISNGAGDLQAWELDYSKRIRVSPTLSKGKIQYFEIDHGNRIDYFLHVTSAEGFEVDSIFANGLEIEMDFNGVTEKLVNIGPVISEYQFSVNFAYGPSTGLAKVEIWQDPTTKCIMLRCFLKDNHYYQLQTSQDGRIWNDIQDPVEGTDRFSVFKLSDNEIQPLIRIQQTSMP